MLQLICKRKVPSFSEICRKTIWMYWKVCLSKAWQASRCWGWEGTQSGCCQREFSLALTVYRHCKLIVIFIEFLVCNCRCFAVECVWRDHNFENSRPHSQFCVKISLMDLRICSYFLHSFSTYLSKVSPAANLCSLSIFGYPWVSELSLHRGKIWATLWRNLFLPYANNKGADQPVHPHSLINAFVVCCLDSIIHVPILAKSNISRL